MSDTHRRSFHGQNYTATTKWMCLKGKLPVCLAVHAGRGSTHTDKLWQWIKLLFTDSQFELQKLILQVSIQQEVLFWDFTFTLVPPSGQIIPSDEHFGPQQHNSVNTV